MSERQTSPRWGWIIHSGNNTFQSAILNSHTRPHVQWALQAPITQAAHCTGCSKSSFLYFNTGGKAKSLLIKQVKWF